MFDWVDIGLHTLVATVLAWVAVFVSGFDFTGETRGGREFSMAGSLIATANTVLWPLRELLQHGGRWGGMQSQLECHHDYSRTLRRASYICKGVLC